MIIHNWYRQRHCDAYESSSWSTLEKGDHMSVAFKSGIESPINQY